MTGWCDSQHASRTPPPRASLSQGPRSHPVSTLGSPSGGRCTIAADRAVPGHQAGVGTVRGRGHTSPRGARQRGGDTRPQPGGHAPRPVLRSREGTPSPWDPARCTWRTGRWDLGTLEGPRARGGLHGETPERGAGCRQAVPTAAGRACVATLLATQALAGRGARVPNPSPECHPSICSGLGGAAGGVAMGRREGGCTAWGGRGINFPFVNNALICMTNEFPGGCEGTQGRRCHLLSKKANKGPGTAQRAGDTGLTCSHARNA